MIDTDESAASPNAEWMQRLLQNAIDAWPQFETDEPVNGGDLVDWFGEWRLNVKACLGLDRPKPQ